MFAENPNIYPAMRKTPREALNALATVLAMPEYVLDANTGRPAEFWLEQQKERVATLPEGLLLPKTLSNKFAVKLADKTRAFLHQTPAALCDAHKKLNPLLMRDIFESISHELVRYADHLRTHRRKGDRPLPPSVKDWCDRTLGAAGLWMESQIFRQIAGRSFPDDLRLPCVDKLCEACIVAALMGRRSAIVDVRAGIQSRWLLDTYREEKRAERRAVKNGTSVEEAKASVNVHVTSLWKLMDQWTEMLGPDAAVVEDESALLAEELYKMRKEREFRLWRERKEHGKSHKDGELPEQSTKNGHPVPHGRRKAHGHSSKKDRSSKVMSGALQPKPQQEFLRPEPRQHGQRLSAVEERPLSTAREEEAYAPPPPSSPYNMPEPQRYAGPSATVYTLPSVAGQGEDVSPVPQFTYDAPEASNPFNDNGSHHDDFTKYNGDDIYDADDVDEAPARAFWKKRDPFQDENGVSDMSDEEEYAEDLDNEYECKSAVPAGLALNKSARRQVDDDTASYTDSTVFTYDPSGGRKRASPPPVPAIPAQYAASSVYSQDDPPQTPPSMTTPLHIRRQGVNAPRKLNATAETVVSSPDDEGPVTPTPFSDPFAGRNTARRSYAPSEVSPTGPPKRLTAAHLMARDGFAPGSRAGYAASVVTPEDSLSFRGENPLYEASVAPSEVTNWRGFMGRADGHRR